MEDQLRYRNEMVGSLQGTSEIASPRSFTFLRESVGAGEIKGARERWVAPAALYTGFVGIDESAWTITSETVIALRLRGAAVVNHNRRVTRTSAPDRDFALPPKGTPIQYLAHGTLKFGQVFLSDSLLDRASDSERLPAPSGRLHDDLSFVQEKTVQALTSDYLRRAFDSRNPATSLEMEGRALLLVDCLLKLHEPRLAGVTSQTGGLSPRHLRRACDFIIEHFAEDIGLDALVMLRNLHIPIRSRCRRGWLWHRPNCAWPLRCVA